VVGSGALLAPSGALLGPSPPPGLRGRFWSVLGLFSARFWALFWSSVSGCFCPVGWGFGPLFGSVSVRFWSLFGLFLGAFGAQKVLVYRAVLRLLVGFRVKSPFSGPRGPKVGQSRSNGAFQDKGQAGVYYNI